MEETPSPAQTPDPTSPPDPLELRERIAALASQDWLARDRARQALVALGAPAVDALIAAMHSPSHAVRQEAAKALGAIADPRGVPALIAALDDERFAVRWLAAVELAAMARLSLIPLLSALQHTPLGVGNLRAGARHILRTQLGGPYGAAIAPVVAALEGAEPGVAVPPAARQALSAIRELGAAGE